MAGGEKTNSWVLEVLKRERVGQARVFGRNELVGLHPTHEGCKKKTADPDKVTKQGEEILNFKEDLLGMKVMIDRRHNEPVQVDRVHHEHPDRPDRQGQRAAFDMLRHQEEERQGKVAESKRRAQEDPAAFKTILVPHRLFGDVSVPDQEELREADVSPKDGKAKEELADILVMLGRDDVFQNPGTTEGQAVESQETEERGLASCEEINAVDRRVPVGIKRHDPVEGSEGRGERKQNDRGGAKGALLHREAEVACLVLLGRTAQEEPRDRHPNDEVKGRTVEEEGGIEVRLLCR